MDFKDKIVVITGGSKGLGKGFAKALAGKKAKVVIASNDQEALNRTADELGVDSFQCDVTIYDDVKALADFVVERYGQVDVWVNNAGIQIAPSNVEDVDVEKLHKLFEVNCFGYFYGCKAALPNLKKQNSGAIININSTAGLSGKPELSAYVASKFAVKGLTLSLREELKDTSISVYGIHPGGIQTEIYKEEYPTDFDEYMTIDYAVGKILENFNNSEPELDLVIRRPKVT